VSFARCVFRSCDVWRPWTARQLWAPLKLDRFPGARKGDSARARRCHGGSSRSCDRALSSSPPDRLRGPRAYWSAHRGVTLQFRAGSPLRLGSDVRCWTANGFFLVRYLFVGCRSALSSGGTLVLHSEPSSRRGAKPHGMRTCEFPLGLATSMGAVGGGTECSTSIFPRLRHPHSPIGRPSTVTTDWDEPVHAVRE